MKIFSNTRVKNFSTEIYVVGIKTVLLSTQNECVNWWMDRQVLMILWPNWPLVKSVKQKIISIFLNQNICCGYPIELSHWDGSFEHPKHMLTLTAMKIFTILRWNFLLINFFVYLELYILLTYPCSLFYSSSNSKYRQQEPG